jgi:hypothetical protein
VYEAIWIQSQRHRVCCHNEGSKRLLDVYRLVAMPTKPRTLLSNRPPSARRVQCDGGLPICQKCSRAGRECQGYEMRLSWPRDGDKRRAITMDLLPLVTRARAGTNPFFINTTWRDVELHTRISPQTNSLPETETSSELWRQPQLSASHMNLVHHCKLETALCY